MSRILLLFALVAIGATSAQASCEANFSSQGVPLLTPLSYKTWMLFPKLDAKKALDRLASAVLAEGYSDMNVDKAYGAITALQETTGSGLPQTLRIVARRVNAGTRVDAYFSIQAGQVTTEELVRGSSCNLIAAAVG